MIRRPEDMGVRNLRDELPVCPAPPRGASVGLVVIVALAVLAGGCWWAL